MHEGTLDAAARHAWQHAIALGRERFAHRRTGRSVPDDLETRWREATARPPRVSSPACSARACVSRRPAARRCPVEVADYLDAVGLTVLGAYGQTEHLCVAFHRPDAYDTDTVGPPMPGTEIRIDDDGEVLLERGPLTFAGYHGKPDATRDAFTTDGEWLRTGDLGRDHGGRAPAPDRPEEGADRAVEREEGRAAARSSRRLIEDPWIGHAMLYGEGERFVSALLVPRRPCSKRGSASMVWRSSTAICSIIRRSSHASSRRWIA